MKKKKILYVVSTLRQSGPTNQLKGIISNLDKEKFEAQVLTLSPEPSDTRIKDFVDLGIRVSTLNLTRIKFQITGKRILKNFLNKYKPDVIHTSGVRADTALSKLNVSSKHCMTIRNYAYDDYVAKFGNIVGKLVAKSNIKAMNKCKYVICCSKTLKEKYSNILANDLYVVQNGVDTEKFTPSKDVKSKYDLRKSLGFPKNKVIFTVVGSLIKRKDPITIIKAFKKANVEQRAVLILLGDGILRKQCESEVDESVFLKGNVDNVNDFFKASDFYLSASKSEGLPNSVLEAGRSGISLILSNIPQHKEIFEPNLTYATFFEVGNEEQLVKSIEKKIMEFNNEINYDLPYYIKRNFSTKVMSNKYQEIYKLIN